jgi:hypothetical protein
MYDNNEHVYVCVLRAILVQYKVFFIDCRVWVDSGRKSAIPTGYPDLQL